MALTGTFFNSTYYLTQYRDVAANWPGTAISHYEMYGATEGRAPNAWFDYQYYRVNNADLQNMTALELFSHYELYGYKEGRIPDSTYANFDEQQYLDDYSDLGDGGVTTSTALYHYLMYGANEDRTAKNDDGTTITPTSSTTGTTFTLTTATDNVSGTTNNDTIIGEFATSPANTANASDVIDGGAGTDIFKLYGTYDSGQLPVTINNIETLEFATVTGTTALDLSSLTKTTSGLETIIIDNAAGWNDGTAGAGTTQGIVTTTAGQSLSLSTGSSSAALGTNGATWAASATDTSLNLTLNGFQGGTGVTARELTITGAAATALNITSSGGKNVISTLTGPTTVTTHTLTGSQSLTYAMAAADAAKVTTVDGSGNTGGSNVDVSAATTSASFKFTGGSGDDSIILADNNLGTLTAGSQLDGGAGTADKLGIKDTALTTTEVAAINAATNFEVLGVNSGITLDASLLTSIKDFSIDGDAIQTISNMATGSNVTLSTAHTAALNLSSATGVTDLGLIIGSSTSGGLNNSGTLTIGQTQVSVASNGAGTGTNVLSLSNADNSTYTITGSNDLNMGTLSGTTTGSKVDASAFTGKLTVTGSAKSDILIGGSGVDTLDGGTITAGVTAVTAVKEVQKFTITGAATSSTDIVVNGVNVAVTNGDSIDVIGGKIAAASAAIVAGGTITTDESVAYDAATDTVSVTYTLAAGSIADNTTTISAGTSGATFGAVGVTTQGVTGVTAVSASSDLLTGGAGADTFTFSSADLDTSAGAVTATITDFVSGSDKIKDTIVGAAGSSTNYLEATSAVSTLSALLTAADTNLTGAAKYYVGQVGSDSYIVTDSDGTGYTNVIKLAGVSLDGIAATDLIA